MVATMVLETIAERRESSSLSSRIPALRDLETSGSRIGSKSRVYSGWGVDRPHSQEVQSLSLVSAG